MIVCAGHRNLGNDALSSVDLIHSTEGSLAVMRVSPVVPVIAFVLLMMAVVTAVGEWYRLSADKPESVRIPTQIEDDPSEKLTITWLGPPAFASAQEGGWIERKLEERFNIEIKPIFLDAEQYRKKKSLMFADGNIPDVIWINDPSTLQRDVYHGFLAEVPYEVLKEHAPTAVSLLREYAPHAWLYSQYQGKNYGLPTKYMGGIYPRPGIWRADWLENVGIEKVPQTLEEMEEALRRFRYDDPDGNGVKDTYGMSGDISKWWWSTFSDVFGAYGCLPFDFQYDNQGEVVWGGITPEAKQTLETLHRWYEDELIDPEFVSDAMEGNQLEGKFKQGRIGYINYMARWDRFDETNDNALVNEIRKINPQARLAAGWFPIGPDGDRGGRVWSAGGNIICFGRQVADDPEKLARVLGMLEALLQEEMANAQPVVGSDMIVGVEARMGRRGEHWQFNDPAKGWEGGWGFIPPYDGKYGARREGMMRGQAYFMLLSGGVAEQERDLPAKAIVFQEKYQKPKWAMQDAFGKPDVVPSAAEILPGLRQYQQTMYARFIRGDVPLSEFDQFVAEWKERGGDQLLSEAKEMAETYRAIRKELDLPAPEDRP